MCKDILSFLVRIFFHLIFSIFQTSLISNVNDCHESWSFDFSFVYLCFKDVKSFLCVMINQWNMLMMPLQSLGLTERFQSWLVVNYSLLAADSRCSLSSREIVLCCSLCKVWVMSGDELFLSTFSCAEHRLLTLPPRVRRPTGRFTVTSWGSLKIALVWETIRTYLRGDWICALSFDILDTEVKEMHCYLGVLLGFFLCRCFKNIFFYIWKITQIMGSKYTKKQTSFYLFPANIFRSLWIVNIFTASV